MSVIDDIALVVEQERLAVFERFDESVALAIGQRIQALAEARGAALTIEIKMWNRPLYYYAMPGTGPDNFGWVTRKSNCVRRFNRASYAMTLRHKRDGKGFTADDAVDPMEIAAHGGSFPIRVKGSDVMGTITVSGVPGRDDHGFVVEAICAHIGVDYSTIALPPE